MRLALLLLAGACLVESSGDVKKAQMKNSLVQEADSEPNLVADLKSLNQLKNIKALSEEEYEAAKGKLLGLGPDPPPPAPAAVPDSALSTATAAPAAAAAAPAVTEPAPTVTEPVPPAAAPVPAAPAVPSVAAQKLGKSILNAPSEAAAAAPNLGGTHEVEVQVPVEVMVEVPVEVQVQVEVPAEIEGPLDLPEPKTEAVQKEPAPKGEPKASDRATADKGSVQTAAQDDAAPGVVADKEVAPTIEAKTQDKAASTSGKATENDKTERAQDQADSTREAVVTGSQAAMTNAETGPQKGGANENAEEKEEGQQLKAKPQAEAKQASLEQEAQAKEAKEAKSATIDAPKEFKAEAQQSAVAVKADNSNQDTALAAQTTDNDEAAIFAFCCIGSCVAFDCDSHSSGTNNLLQLNSTAPVMLGSKRPADAKQEEKSSASDSTALETKGKAEAESGQFFNCLLYYALCCRMLGCFDNNAKGSTSTALEPMPKRALAA